MATEATEAGGSLIKPNILFVVVLRWFLRLHMFHSAFSLEPHPVDVPKNRFHLTGAEESKNSSDFIII